MVNINLHRTSITRVKICGITRTQDALHAAQLGADALGFMFYDKSPRYVDLECAQSIIKQLPPFIQSIGVFVNSSPDDINYVISKTNIDCIQLHGNESPSIANQLNRPFLRALAVRNNIDLTKTMNMWQAVGARAILLDSYNPDSFGGSGKTFDWDAVPKHSILPLILSGGLQVDNVQEACRIPGVHAVDVSSGVEDRHGIKNHHKMAHFIHNARHAFS